MFVTGIKNSVLATNFLQLIVIILTCKTLNDLNQNTEKAVCSTYSTIVCGYPCSPSLHSKPSSSKGDDQK